MVIGDQIPEMVIGEIMHLICDFSVIKEAKQLEVLKSKSVYSTAVRMFKTQVSEIMVNAENNLIETNITELVYALKNNMDNFSKLLLSTPTNIDILLLCLIFRSNSKRKE